jgi:hypothetical protein
VALGIFLSRAQLTAGDVYEKTREELPECFATVMAAIRLLTPMDPLDTRFCIHVSDTHSVTSQEECPRRDQTESVDIANPFPKTVKVVDPVSAELVIIQLLASVLSIERLEEIVETSHPVVTTISLL